MIHVQQHGSVTAIRMARTFLGRPLYWTTVYWIDGLLIDSGPAHLSRELVTVLKDLAVYQIVVTHAHHDQIGGLHSLRQRYPSATIFASPQAISVIQQPSRLPPYLYQRFLWGVPKPVADVEPLPLRLETDRFSLRVIETPGHSRDHVSFFETKYRWLFSGDAFISGQERAWTQDNEMFGVISSLRTMASLRPERLFPASGNVRRVAQPELHGKVAQLLGLCREVARCDSLGLTTAEIAHQLLGGETRMRFWTQGHLSAINLIQACRHYNGIFNPVEDPVNPAQAGRAPEKTGDTSGSSASESADQGDWRSSQ